MMKTTNLSLADAGAEQRADARPSMAYESIDQAFPDVDPGLVPFGSKILVQMRTPMRKSRGGIVLPEESRDTEQWNTQVAKVIRLGPVAFCNRDTLEPWPEGVEAQPGMFVRCPKYGGDRWEVPVSNSNDSALFALFNDLELSGEVTGDPLEMVAFLK